jgi:hypothetical protein
LQREIDRSTERAPNEKTPEDPVFTAISAAFSEEGGYPQGDSNNSKIPRENPGEPQGALQIPMQFSPVPPPLTPIWPG